MAQHSKRSGVQATASGHKVFHWARLKLTGMYVAILGLILVGFSVSLYQSLQHNLADANEDNFSDARSHHIFVSDTLGSVKNEIILIDFIILVAAAGASYVLAGYTLRPIQSSMEAQKKFSENASHELRTPLAVMKNEAEVLLRNPNPTRDLIHSTLASAIEEIDRMSQMAEDLLMLARSASHTALAMEKIDIAEAARNAMKKMHPLAALKGVKTAMTSGAPLFVVGNNSGLERVFLNLLQNAIEYTPQGGFIAMDISEQGSSAAIEISDTGAGIEEKDLPHVFERFYKKEGTSGTGLGLSIVQELVSRHGGTIDIASAAGKGTSVSIRLPLSA